jgi:aryl-alcohol dehydrogenase-like predicted oxidoreductase
MTLLPAIDARRPLGKSGITVSSLAWGNWRLCGDDIDAVLALLHAALDAGIDFIDTADIYGPDNGEPFGASEALLGRALAKEPGLRDRLILATKGGISMGVPYDSSATYLAGAIDASLARLGVDHVDLWQIHRPDIRPKSPARSTTRIARGRSGPLAFRTSPAARSTCSSNICRCPSCRRSRSFPRSH